MRFPVRGLLILLIGGCGISMLVSAGKLFMLLSTDFGALVGLSVSGFPINNY